MTQDKHRVVIVDDSPVIRTYLRGLLSDHYDIEVVGVAEDGLQAIDRAKEFAPDVMLMDIEMPNLGGLEALPKVLEISPNTVIIMISSLSKSRLEVNVQALSKGASGYIEKPRADSDKENFKKDLLEKIRSLDEESKRHKKSSLTATGEGFSRNNNAGSITLANRVINKPRALAIGCSTGGPQALADVFMEIRQQLTDIPVFITQHMPSQFTEYMADRLSKVSGAKCVEGKDGEIVQPGTIYLAPGGSHMVIENQGASLVIRLDDGPAEHFCKPSVNPMMRSIARIFGKDVLAVMLTGMGQDGLEGCEEVFNAGGTILAQDEDSSVVWGMPGAVAGHGICSDVIPLKDVASRVLGMCI